MEVAHKKLKVGDLFHRDDFSVKIIDIRQIIELDGTEPWRIGTEIYIDDMLLMTHGFKVVAVPTRTHFSFYANKWVPKTIVNYINGGKDGTI